MNRYKTSQSDSIQKFLNSFRPQSLRGFAEEALKCEKVEEFEWDFLRDIKHGTYWHITNNPNFTIDSEKGPRDMSSMSLSQTSDRGPLMVTSHLEHWTNYYRDSRKFAAEIDLTNVPRKDYFQVSRGFGNEFFIPDARKAKVVQVLPMNKALKLDRYRHSKMPSSQEKLYDFFKYVKSEFKNFEQAKSSEWTQQGKEKPAENDVICSYCGKTIRKNVPDLKGPSHGICPSCYEIEMKKLLSQPAETIAYSLNWYKIAKDTNHEYSWVYINLSKNIQKKLIEFGESIDPEDCYEKEADGGLENDPHITVKYGLLTDFPKDIRERIDEEKGGKAYLGKSTIFEKEKYDVVKIDVESEDLDRLHSRLNELPHEDKYPDYKPHATIAYVKKGKGKKYIGKFKINESFKFDKVYFGNRKDRDYSVKLLNKRMNWYKTSKSH